MKGFLSKLLVGLISSMILISIGISFGASIESITVYEMTGYVQPFGFGINDPRLTTKIESLGEGNYDFRFLSEVYDLYISDSDGTPNPNGMYLTIDCVRDLLTGCEGCPYVGLRAGHNIDAVSLDYSDGAHLWATEVTNYILGYEQPLSIAQPENSLSSPDNIPTFMGDQFSSLTVGFGLEEPIIPPLCPPDTRPPTGSVHAYPNMIWPPNNEYVEVEIKGYLFDESGIESAYIEYDGNTVLLTPQIGNYWTLISVQAKKGATYTVELYSSDSEGNGPELVDSTIISVPLSWGNE